MSAIMSIVTAIVVTCHYPETYKLAIFDDSTMIQIIVQIDVTNYIENLFHIKILDTSKRAHNLIPNT